MRMIPAYVIKVDKQAQAQRDYALQWKIYKNLII